MIDLTGGNPGDKAAKNIINVINAAADAKTAQTELQKQLMLKQISDKMDLQQQGALTRQNMQIKADAFNSMAGAEQPSTPTASTDNGLGVNGVATGATPATIGAQPPLQGQPQQSPMSSVVNPVQQPTPQQPPSPTPMLNAAAQPSQIPALQGIVPTQNMSIPSPIGKPLPPPQGNIVMGPTGPMLNPNANSPDNKTYAQIYNKWRSGQPLSTGESKWVQTKFSNDGNGEPLPKNNTASSKAVPAAATMNPPNVTVPPTASTPSLDQERAQYDNTPVTAQSIAKDSMMQNPEWRNSVAQSIAFGGTPQQRMIPAPGAVDVEKEKNPFFLSKWGQHILNDNDSNGPVIQDMIKNHGLNQVLNELPATVTQPALTAAKYQQDPNNMSSTMGGGNQRRQMMTLIKAINPNWSEINYKQIQSNIPEFLNPNGANGKALSAISQTPYHLDTLDKDMTALNSSQFRNIPLFNKLGEAIRGNVQGNPQLAAAQTSMAAVTNELTTAWSGTNNSDSKKEEWNKALALHSAPADWPALRATAARLLNEAGQTREDGFKRISGGMSLKDYNGQSVIPQEQKKILDKLQGGYNIDKGVQSFNSEADAKAAGLPDGTRITVNGQTGTWRN